MNYTKLASMATERTIVYVTREIERALGQMPSSRYRIVSNRTSYGESIQKDFPEFVLLIDAPEKDLLSTTDLLNNEKTISYINGISPIPDILVFKNTPRVEAPTQTHGWKLLNPKASFSEEVENKVTQVSWLGDLGKKYLPEHEVTLCKNLRWNKVPRIIQWAHGHTGSGTILINSEAELKVLQEKFPERMARSTEFIVGPSFTLSAVVTSDSVLIGNPSYQITGILPFTENPLSTIGNDWSAPHTFLSGDEIETIESMTREIGLKLQASGWRGLFGIDLMKDEERNRLVLIEINARQPASVSFESYLQGKNRERGIKGLTIFEAHLKALQGESINEPLIQINDGAQIIQRVTNATKTISAKTISKLTEAGYTTISYENTEPNSDLLRVQSEKGIIEKHGKLNTRAKEIEEAISQK